MLRSPIRYDGVLARSLPPLTCLWIQSFRPPYAGIWAVREPDTPTHSPVSRTLTHSLTCNAHAHGGSD
jgi:hypothetical protein